LSRFLIRAAAPQRLSEQRGRKDFVIDPAREDAGFVVFLTTFARNTRVSSMSPTDFVTELLRRWQAQPPPEAPATGAAQRRTRTRTEAGRLHQLLTDRHRAGPRALRRDPAPGWRRRRLVRQVCDQPGR